MSGFMDSGRAGFGEIEGTPGGMPHIIQYLWGKYRERIQEKLDALHDQGKKTKTIDLVLTETTAARFIDFCTTFLTENRVVENFPLDDNHGIRLSNTDLLAISPGVDLRGTMQDAHAIGVTTGKGQRSLDGVVRDAGVKII